MVEHRHGPLLVLAGPGTGKTTTIVESICARLGDVVDPLPADAVLALTFGRKAAAELRDRVTARLGGGVVPTVATFHSFAYALLRRTDSPEDYLNPPRLMSGAEEDVRIRELLRGAVEDGSVDWPDELAGALPTLGLANEVRAVLAKARELGLEGGDLRRIGQRSGRPAWAAVGQLAREEQEVMVLENVMDYGELLLRAVVRAHEPAVSALLARQFRAVYVDEYQDTDPLQVALLRALAGPQTSLVAVGDPDQAIYGFRGADVRGLLRFPEAFRTRGRRARPPSSSWGARAGSGRSSVPSPRPSSARGCRTGWLPEQVLAHRNPACAPVEHPEVDDVVTVRTYGDRGSQAAHIARELRLAHVRREVPWRELAVLVRSGNQIPALQRALHAAGVPVVVAADEIPLRSEPAVATLLAAMTLAAHPQGAAPGQVLDVLMGPLAGLTASDIRRLGRALRAQHHEAGYASPPSDVLIRELVLGPLLGEHAAPGGLPPDDPISVTVARLTSLLVEVRAADRGRRRSRRRCSGRCGRAGARRTAGRTGFASAAIHGLAVGRPRPRRRHGARSTRPSGWPAATRASSASAPSSTPSPTSRSRRRRSPTVAPGPMPCASSPPTGPRAWSGTRSGSSAPRRACGPTCARAARPCAPRSSPRPASARVPVRPTCSRRSAACSTWPAPGPAASCTSPRSTRRTRAANGRAGSSTTSGRRWASPRRRPSPAGPRHQVSLDGLVAELRLVAMDPASSDALREAAVERLAVLAAQRDPDGEPLVPLADPARWWGLLDPTASDRPVRDPEAPVSLSGSGLDGILGCPLKWFLEHEVRAETPRGTATSFGSVVHAVADFVAKGDIPETLEDMDAEVDRVWSELRFEAGWQSESERREARAALARFLGYHLRADRELVGTETRVGAEVVVPTPDGGTETVRLSGFIDRVERDGQGRLVPIDLKNMRYPVAQKDIPEHGQLGVYQLLLREGGMAAADPDRVDDARRGRRGRGSRARPAPGRRRQGRRATPRCSSRRPSAPTSRRGSRSSSATPPASSARRPSWPPPDRAAPTAPTRPPARPRSKASRCCHDGT